MKKETVNVGIIGLGTVGSGTARILLENAGLLRDRLGFSIRLKKIADLDIKKARALFKTGKKKKIPDGLITTDSGQVLEDPEIDIVVELIGGLRAAGEVILRAVRNKKHVVTANKALLAEKGNLIFSEARKNRVRVGFEASVGGGIPIIKALGEGLVANRINAVFGIVNGTSNYILTRMTEEGVEFSAALKEAKALGYAEADPTLDVEGIDSAHKLTILASIAYGIPLSFKGVYTEGITKITPQDVAFASELGFKIKLLAIAKQTGRAVELRVHPTMLPREYLISQVDGVMNAIYVNGSETGDTLYYGRGAGALPTGSAVVSDIASIGKLVAAGYPDGEMGLKIFPASPLALKPIEDVVSMNYFRFTAMDKPGVLSNIAGILGRNNISIASVIQKGRREGGAVPVVILTHSAREKDVRRALARIDELPAVAAKTHRIRVEGRPGEGENA